MKNLMPRQERFCREFVNYANGSTAAKTAGYAPRTARQHAYRLLKHPRIRARISAMQTELAQENAASRDVLLGKLESVYRRSLADHNFQAAVRAVEAQARISGLAATHRLEVPVAMPKQGARSHIATVPSTVPSTGPAGSPVTGNGGGKMMTNVDEC